MHCHSYHLTIISTSVRLLAKNSSSASLPSHGRHLILLRHPLPPPLLRLAPPERRVGKAGRPQGQRRRGPLPSSRKPAAGTPGLLGSGGPRRGRWHRGVGVADLPPSAADLASPCPGAEQWRAAISGTGSGAGGHRGEFGHAGGGSASPGGRSGLPTSRGRATASLAATAAERR